MSEQAFGTMAGGLLAPGAPADVTGQVGPNYSSKERVKAALSKGWRQGKASDYERRGRYVVDRGSGLLFYELRHDPLLSQSPVESVSVFVTDPDGSRMVFLTRPVEGPTTVAELDELDREQQAKEQAHEKRRREFLRKQKQVPVPYGLADGWGPVSLRDAVERLEHHGGRLALDRNGELHLTLPAELVELTGWNGDLERELRQSLAADARVVMHCRRLVERLLSDGDARGPLSQRVDPGFVTVEGSVA